MDKDQVLAHIIDCDSDSSDQDDTDLPIFIKPGSESGPEFSIDSLLAARESECLSSPIRSVSAPILEPETKFEDPFDLQALTTVDACVFDFPENLDMVAARAFIGEAKELPVRELSECDKEILENYPDMIRCSGEFALRCVASPFVRKLELCLRGVDEYSIDFEALKSLFMSSGVEASKVFALANPSFIANAGDAREGMFWLFIAALAEPVLAFGRHGHVIVRSLRKYLREAELCVEEVDSFVEKMVMVFQTLPPYHLSGFISLFPIVDVASAQLVARFGLKYIFAYFGRQDPAFENLAGVIGGIKEHYEKKDEKQLAYVSAILGLTERAVAAGIRLRVIDSTTVQQISTALRFTTGSSDASEMIQIKEQLQVTRAQLEYLALSM